MTIPPLEMGERRQRRVPVRKTDDRPSMVRRCRACAARWAKQEGPMKRSLALLLPFLLASAAFGEEAKSGKEAVFTKSAPDPKGPYSQAIKAGGFVFAAGQVARDPETG